MTDIEKLSVALYNNVLYGQIIVEQGKVIKELFTLCNDIITDKDCTVSDSQVQKVTETFTNTVKSLEMIDTYTEKIKRYDDESVTGETN